MHSQYDLVVNHTYAREKGKMNLRGRVRTRVADLYEKSNIVFSEREYYPCSCNTQNYNTHAIVSLLNGNTKVCLAGRNYVCM